MERSGLFIYLPVVTGIIVVWGVILDNVTFFRFPVVCPIDGHTRLRQCTPLRFIVSLS